MRERVLANRTLRWVILAGCLVLAVAVWRLFWDNATDGRTSREVERIESAQDRIVEGAPTTALPAAPAAIPPPPPVPAQQ